MAAPNHPRTLATGEYFIQMHSAPGLYIAVDERSEIVPRSVIALPGGTRAPKWTIQSFGDSRYVIKLQDQGTIAQGTSVVALDTHTPEQWQVTWYPQQGSNCYMINSTYPGPTEGSAWVLSKPEGYGHVVLKDIGAFPPEQPPKEALFNFIPVSEVAAASAVEAVSAQFTPGDYLIRKHNNGPYIAVDARGKDPWQVIILPGGTEAPKWTINVDVRNPDFYSATSNDKTTFPDGNEVRAGTILISYNWRILPVPAKGKHCYMLVTAHPVNGKTLSWEVSTSTGYTPVGLKDVGVRIPELDPPEEVLFDLIPVASD